MNPHEKPTAPGPTSNPSNGRSQLGFRLIGAMKLAGGLLLVAAGFGIFRLIHRDLGATVEHWVTRFHLDPENRLVREAVTRVAGMKPEDVKALGLGTFFYAALETTEGIGLILVKRWAEYLTVVATASLLPLEFYEIAHKANPIRLGVLVVNVAILVYLIVKLRQARSAPEN